MTAAGFSIRRVPESKHIWRRMERRQKMTRVSQESGGPYFVGYGELIFDHLFVDPTGVGAWNGRSANAVYQGGRGGGSVWNILASLAILGSGKCYAFGGGAADSFSEDARIDLASCGVHTDGLTTNVRSRTNLIFEINGAGAFGAHDFTGTCPICKSVSPSPMKRPDVAHLAQTIQRLPPGILIVDRITSVDRVELAERLRSSGFVTVADVGRVGYLRYSPLPKVIAALSAFDVVFLSQGVASSLSKRLRKHGVTESLWSYLHRHGVRLLVTLRGAAGAGCMAEWLGETEISVPTSSSGAPRDTAGAGDAFVARLLREIGQRLLDSGSSLREGAPQAALEASLQCARDFAEQKIGYLGARGHIAQPVLNWATVQQALLGKTLDDLRSIQKEGCECILCLSVPRATRGRSKAGMKLIAGQQLLSRAFFSFEREEAAQVCRKIMNLRSNAYVVGTGGSYPAAVFIANVLSICAGEQAEACRPFEYVTRGARAGVLVVVTYSGRTPDCRRAVKAALARGVEHVVVVTSSTKPAILDGLDLGGTNVEVVSYGTKEGGFISFAGTLAPCFVWAAAAGMDVDDAAYLWSSWRAEPARHAKVIQTVVAELNHLPLLHVFGSGWAWPAVLDFESKLTEGGLGSAHLHEVKDFSHGRFMSVMNQQSADVPKLFVYVGQRSAYEEYFVRRMKELPNFIILGSDREGIVGALDLMWRLREIVVGIATGRGVDISRPAKIPSLGLDLYRWRQDE